MEKLLASILLITITDCASAQVFQWANTFGSADYDAAQDCAMDATGNVFVTGLAYGSFDADPGPGTYLLNPNGCNDVFVAAYSPAGEFLWAHMFGGNLCEASASIALDSGGNVLLSGSFRGTVDFDPGTGVSSFTSAGNLDIFYVKFNNSGVFQWAHTIGSAGADESHDVEFDINDNIIATGLFTTGTDFDPGASVQTLTPTGAQDVFILKWTSAGDFSWVKKIGASSGESSEEIISDSSGNVFVTGLFWGNVDFNPDAGTFFLDSGFFGSSAFLLKLGPGGDFIWAGMFGGSGSDVAYGLDLDESGNAYITGSFSGTGDFNPGSGTFNLVADSNTSYPDLFVLKLNNSGGFVWAKSVGIANLTQQGYAISVTSAGESWITGLYDGTVDFDPGAGVFNLSDSGPSQAFILNLDVDGNFIWASSVGASQEDYGLGVFVNETNVSLCGVYSWYDVDLDPTDGVSLYSSTNFANDGFLIKLGIGSCEPPILTVTSTAATCADGTATVDATGNGPFTYLWNDSQSQTTQTATGLMAANYSIEVTDNFGCTTTAQVTVQPDSCQGDFTGDEIVTVADLLVFMPQFGCQGNCCPYDFDYNNVVNINDMLAFMSAFGVECQ